jgi:hypothetical protein
MLKVNVPHIWTRIVVGDTSAIASAPAIEYCRERNSYMGWTLWLAVSLAKYANLSSEI